MLTPERLKEIKERCERATEGPWWTAEGVIYDNEAAIGDCFRDDDAEFIIHAREDVPVLVAEVERLWALKDELRKLIQFFRDRADELRKLAREEAEDERDEALLRGHVDGLIEAADALEETLKELEAIRSAE